MIIPSEPVDIFVPARPPCNLCCRVGWLELNPPGNAGVAHMSQLFCFDTSRSVADVFLDTQPVLACCLSAIWISQIPSAVIFLGQL